MIEQAKNFWGMLPRPSQAILILIVFVAVLAIGGGVGSFVSSVKDRQFDKRQAEYERQLDTLKTEREQAIGRAQAFERQAKEAEAKVAINEAIIAASGKRAEAAQQAVNNEQAKMDSEIDAAGNPVSDDERARRISERLKRLFPK